MVEPRAAAELIPIMGRVGNSAPPRNIALHGRGLWKIFGVSAQEFIRVGGLGFSSAEMAHRGWAPAVRDAVIEAGKGEIFVVMGLSGSGKSTLLRCLSRLIEPTAGEVVFEGLDLLKASENKLVEIRRRKMGMVFQHFALLPNRTVLENVAFPLQIQGVPEGAREKRAHEMIELVGLNGRENSYPSELSGGQQQRVGIARSLATEPELWFLDEPFSALDPLIRRDMQDEFLRLQRTLKKTIIFITHDFDEAIRLADRIAIMKDGVIEQTGTAEEMVLSPATPYVREFTKGVSRLKVMLVRSAASAVTGNERLGEVIAADAMVVSVIQRAVESTLPLRVVDNDGTTIGMLRKETVMKELSRLGTTD